MQTRMQTIAEIGPCEFSKEVYRRFIICKRGIKFVLKSTQINSPCIRANACNPFSVKSVPRDPFIFGRSLVGSHILMVLLIGTKPEIASPVVKSVPIDMVNMKTIASSHNHPMHVNGGKLSVSTELAGSIENLAFCYYVPLKLRQKCVVGVLNNRYHASGQSYFFHGGPPGFGRSNYEPNGVQLHHSGTDVNLQFRKGLYAW